MRDRTIIGRRQTWYLSEADMAADSCAPHEEREGAREICNDLDWATLVSSRSVDVEGVHYPVLDLDFGAKLVPSRTEGHFHLYLDKAMSWEQYANLLYALAIAGVIEWGYLGASLQRKQTFVRWPIEEVSA